MLDILTIVVGVFDFASMVLLWAKYWRIACGFLVAASAIVAVCFFTSSPAIRSIVGFHLFVVIVTIGIVWEQKRGRLKGANGSGK